MAEQLRRTPSRFHIWALAVFLVALTIRLSATALFVGLSVPPRASANPDQVDYEALAWSLSAGRGYTWSDGTPTAARPPGTPFVLAPVYWLAGRSWLAGRVWFALQSAASCTLLMYAVRPVLGAPAALIGGAGLALYPGHWYYSMHFLSEVPYGLFFTGFFGCSLSLVRRPRILVSALGGLLLGCAVLVRPNALLFLPLTAFLLLWLDRHRRQALLMAAVMSASTLLVIAPWMYRNRLALGTATISTVGGWTFWGAHNEQVLADRGLAGSWIPLSDLQDPSHPLPPSIEEVRRSAISWRYGRAFIRENLKQMPYLVLMKLYRLVSPFSATENRAVYWVFAISWCLIAPVAGVGFYRWWSFDHRTAAAAIVPLVGTVLTVVIFYGSVRFRDSVMPVIFAGVGASALSISRLRPDGPEVV